MGGKVGAVGIAIGSGAAGGAIWGGAGGATLAEPPITRVNSPGAAAATAGVLIGICDGICEGVCRGSKLSVKDCSGGEIGAAGWPVPSGVPPPPPNIRVNSPGAFCGGEPAGKGSRWASEGGESGLLNSRVNSPGWFSGAIRSGTSGADGVTGCGGSARWLWPEPSNNRVNSPGPGRAGSLASALASLPEGF
jgi:hypothetical protein